MISWIAIGFCTVLVVGSGVLAAMLDRPGPIRLRHWVEEAGGGLRRLYDQPARFEAFRYLISVFAAASPVVFLAALLWVVSDPPGTSAYRVFGLAVGTTLVLVLGTQLLNRFLVNRNPEKVLRRLTVLYRVILPLVAPLVVLCAFFLSANAVERQEDDEDDASDDEIEAFLDVGAREGILEPGEEDLIQRVIDFGDAVVRSVMTPRTEVVSAPVDTSLEELAEIVVDSTHSRIPLTGDSIDDVRGVLHIRDLLRGMRSSGSLGVRDLAMSPLFVPATKPLNDLLGELQAKRVHMAIVLDEYGATAGVVTVEDLLEEIVGEIVDEHDEEEAMFEKLSNGAWRIDGMTSLDRLSEIFSVELDLEPYETVGGLIFGRLGNLPEPGTSLEAHGLLFHVDSVDERRIDSLTVTPATSESKEPQASQKEPD